MQKEAYCRVDFLGNLNYTQYSVIPFFRKDNSMIHKSNQSIVLNQERNTRKKTLEELDMMDAFLFEASTENPEDAAVIARTIVKRVTGHDLKEFTLENQKQFVGTDLNKRGIRMDLWVRETDEGAREKPVVRLYDIEPNIYYDHLPKRSRFYQAKADAKELPAGTEFEMLPELIMIWILPYDPFGDDLMLYTVKNMVVENNELVYNDGVLKLYLYTKGKKGGSDELRALLKYFEETTQDNAVDADLKAIQEIVGNIKHSKKEEKRFMTLQEMIDHSYDDGVQQGIQQGIIQTCQSLKQTKEKTIETLKAQCNITDEMAAEYIERYWEEK